jgi:hypothetical protein
MAMKYINILQSKAPKKLPKFGFLVWKRNIWQPWFQPLHFLAGNISRHSLPLRNVEVVRREEGDGADLGQDAQAEAAAASTARPVTAAALHVALTNAVQQLMGAPGTKGQC